MSSIAAAQAEAHHLWDLAVDEESDNEDKQQAPASMDLEPGEWNLLMKMIKGHLLEKQCTALAVESDMVVGNVVTCCEKSTPHSSEHW